MGGTEGRTRWKKETRVLPGKLFIRKGPLAHRGFARHLSATKVKCAATTGGMRMPCVNAVHPGLGFSLQEGQGRLTGLREGAEQA